jgi:hypothetical protein
MRVTIPRPVDLSLLAELEDQPSERPTPELLYARIPSPRAPGARDEPPATRDRGFADHEVDFYVR